MTEKEPKFKVGDDVWRVDSSRFVIEKVKFIREFEEHVDFVIVDDGYRHFTCEIKFIHLTKLQALRHVTSLSKEHARNMEENLYYEIRAHLKEKQND